MPLPEDLDYREVNGLSNELREKLARIRPNDLGQAARISGMTPAAISLLLDPRQENAPRAPRELSRLARLEERDTRWHERDEANRDPMSRAAVRQLAILGVLCLVGLAALIAGLGWLSSLTATGAAALPAIDAATRTITTSIRNEPPNLDSMRAIGCVEHHGVQRTSSKGCCATTSAAISCPASPSAGRSARAARRSGCAQDALWSDGKPVTAHDFVFAWRTAVDPATASQYAFIIYPREERRGDQSRRVAARRARRTRRRRSRARGRVREPDRVLRQARRVAQTYCPCARTSTRAARVATGPTPTDLLYNGPFALASWVHGASLRFEKNPTYWDRDCDQAQRHRHRCT